MKDLELMLIALILSGLLFTILYILWVIKEFKKHRKYINSKRNVGE